MWAKETAAAEKYKVHAVGRHMLSVGGGLRYWVDGPQNGPDGFGIRLVVTLLYPQT